MNCDVCQQQQATVFLTQIVDGQVRKVNLCEQCASEKGVTDPAGFALADVLMGMGSEETTQSFSAEKTCDTCGFTESEFKKTGRLGCSECYEVFSENLESLLRAMHKGTRHIGKVPKHLSAMKARKDKLDELQGKLRSAVQEEDFESAADLRDEIANVQADFDREMSEDG